MIRRILETPDPSLREVAEALSEFEPWLEGLIADMYSTMHASSGLGLAAPQLGIPLRIVVIQLPEDQAEGHGGVPYTLINPDIIEGGPREKMTEGCLSLPGYRAMVERCNSVVVTYRQLDGKCAALTAQGLLAQAVQHEVDHLNGVLFIDHLDSMLELQQIPPEPLDWSYEDEAEAG